MSIKKFLISRLFLTNLLFAVIILVVLISIIMWALKLYTHHGEAYPLPNLNGLTEIEVKEKVELNNLRYKIIDSAYIEGAIAGSVIDQIPKPGFKVKKNRTVFLTINATSPEQVILPKLRDISFRQAQVMIENCGLTIGEISFEPSEFSNLVLNVLIDSTEIKEGEKCIKGTPINLIVGKGYGNEVTTLPNLIGHTTKDAKILLSKALLNMGVIIYDQSFFTEEDSLNATIWRQRPNPKTTSNIEIGTSIDIWITVNQEKIKNALELGQ